MICADDDLYNQSMMSHCEVNGNGGLSKKQSQSSETDDMAAGGDGDQGRKQGRSKGQPLSAAYADVGGPSRHMENQGQATGMLLQFLRPSSGQKCGSSTQKMMSMGGQVLAEPFKSIAHVRAVSQKQVATLSPFLACSWLRGFSTFFGRACLHR